MSPRTKLKAYGAIGALLLLAVLTGRASPGFPLANVGGAVGRTIQHALSAVRPAAPLPPAPPKAVANASAFALSDVPRPYLALYLNAANTCPALSWQVLAGIGKVESDHGRSPAPGVRSGVNRAGCCSGPMQFNIRNGPPSTWDSFGTGQLTHVYDPRHAIPAAARKLCADGLAHPSTVRTDPCPQVAGTPAQHQALRRYNNACWYVHQVLVLAGRYTTSPTPPPAADPFVRALVANPNLQTTRGAGCDPGPDLASGRVDLRVQSLLWLLAERWQVRVSCVRSGHATYVRGTRRVSNHTVWRALDIDRVDGEPVTPASARARALVAWLDGLQGVLRPVEVGSPFTLGHRPYFTDEGHRDHIHIGYGAL